MEDIYNPPEPLPAVWSEIVSCTGKFYGYPDDINEIKKVIKEEFSPENGLVVALVSKYDMDENSVTVTFTADDVTTGIDVLHIVYDILDSKFNGISYEINIGFAKIVEDKEAEDEAVEEMMKHTKICDACGDLAIIDEMYLSERVKGWICPDCAEKEGLI